MNVKESLLLKKTANRTPVPSNLPRVMDSEQYETADRLLVAIDCIILVFDIKQLKALLIKRYFAP
jgi:hypothetical protein